LLFILFVIFISLPVISSKNTSLLKNVLKDAISNNKIENKDTATDDQILFTDKIDRKIYDAKTLKRGMI